jgi:hypothetical protein
MPSFFLGVSAAQPAFGAFKLALTETIGQLNQPEKYSAATNKTL